MKLSTWKPALKKWVSSQVTVDNWDLEAPDRPGVTVGFIPPLRGYRLELRSPAEVLAEATQDVHLLKSYPGSLAYVDLPLAALEGFYQTLAIRIAHDYADISPDLTDLDMEFVDRPVSVKVMGDERSEWLIELQWAFNIKYLALPEVGQVQQPFPLRAVITGVHRSLLRDPEFTNDSVLDYRSVDLIELP